MAAYIFTTSSWRYSSDGFEIDGDGTGGPAAIAIQYSLYLVGAVVLENYYLLERDGSNVRVHSPHNENQPYKVPAEFRYMDVWCFSVENNHKLFFSIDAEWVRKITAPGKRRLAHPDARSENSTHRSVQPRNCSLRHGDETLTVGRLRRELLKRYTVK